MANGQKTGGRRKGTKNRKTVRRETILANADAGIVEGISPLEVMAQNMRFFHERGDEVLTKIMMDDGGSVDLLKELMKFREMSQQCAKDAAPYIHPRLQAVEHTGKDGKDLIPDHPSKDVARAVLDILREARSAPE